MNSFYHILIDWYSQNKRELPWRSSKDPYLIWLSEIILQQTRVEQGMSYFYKFQNEFPTVKDLASASEDEVLKLWEGLGYYSRGRNLLKTAQSVVDNYGGNFPTSSKELLNLKGIGPYTSAAISSIAFGEKIVAVDGNVFRVLARYFDIELDIAQPKTRKYFQELGDSLIEGDQPGDFNQAIMDLGSSICTPKNPKCSDCPLENSCESQRNKTIESRPVKTKKIKIRDRYLNFFIIEKEGKILYEKRDSGIWNGLHQFPMVETENRIDSFSNTSLVQEPRLLYSKNKPHKLSHQNLHISFWKAESIGDGSYKQIDQSELQNLSWPKPLKSFIEEEFLKIDI